MNTMFRVQGSGFRVCYRQGGLVHAEHGTRNTERAALGVLLAAAMLLVPMAALSQAMTDPTLPPAGFAAKALEGEGAPNQLQSVIISPTRKAAIINGVVVELGGKYGDAVLIKVAEDEVVLRSGNSRQVLKLHPAVEKVEIAPAAGMSAPRKTKPKSKVKAEPKAVTQPGANPADDGGTRAR
jgi:MSHA biogenesis protein MshK